ncbi:hypothetical protein, partial [Salmonella sp. S146_54837]|uniref:hypothetical protein n=1 Tax=Salmonella sp. S146_54837 TaxID=2665635 RepID=UPI001659D60C
MDEIADWSDESRGHFNASAADLATAQLIECVDGSVSQLNSKSDVLYDLLNGSERNFILLKGKGSNVELIFGYGDLRLTSHDGISPTTFGPEQALFGGGGKLAVPLLTRSDLVSHNLCNALAF